MDQKDILEALRKVKHPETGNDIVSQEMVENLVIGAFHPFSASYQTH